MKLKTIVIYIRFTADCQQGKQGPSAILWLRLLKVCKPEGEWPC